VNLAVCLGDELGPPVVAVSGERAAQAEAAIHQGVRRFREQAERRRETRRFASHLRRVPSPDRQVMVALPACPRAATCTGQGTPGPGRNRPCPQIAATVRLSVFDPFAIPNGAQR